MKKWLLNFMIGIVFFTNALVAEDYPQAVIIFDASGSMWGQIEGKTKIEIARETLKNVVKEWNPAVHLGLTVYGHRSKGNCDDIETVIPVGVVDKEKLIATVISIQPKGKTPISRSLRKVANELKYTEEKATIVLISDGMETCDPDPCETAKGLEKEGIDFVTHVIGFDVDKKTDEQLQCIASATGGEYFSAKNATALNDAMKIIAKKVEKAEPKPVANTLENNIEISASETENGKWINASHTIYTNENGKAEDRITFISSDKKNVGKKQLPVGKYIAKSSYNNFKKETAFEIKAGEVTKINLVMGETGNIEISASETENGKWIDASHTIYTNENGKAEDRIDHIASNKKNVGKKQLPVGKYIAKSSYNNFKKETAFEIKAGETVQIRVEFSQFFIESKCSDMNAEVKYTIFTSSGQLVYNKKTKCSDTLTVTLDDGDYSIEIQIGSATKKENKFSIGRNTPNKITIDLQNMSH